MKEIGDIIDRVHCAECQKFMADMPADSVDTIITDPPYGLGFMGRDWDTFKPGYRADGWAGYDNQPKTGPAMHAGKYYHSRNAEFQAWFTIEKDPEYCKTARLRTQAVKGQEQEKMGLFC